jgi:hypothetical protein
VTFMRVMEPPGKGVSFGVNDEAEGVFGRLGEESFHPSG